MPTPAFSTDPSILPCILALPAGEQVVVVDKTHQRLLLITHGNQGLEIERCMICTTGQHDGNKEKPGDKRTPEGIYFCRKLLLPPKLPAMYGPCALPLNYPNPIDNLYHRGGKGIWLHGIHKNRSTRSTRGCVVLQNKDLVYLAHHIHPLMTPIIIENEIREIPRPDLDQQAEADRRLLARWQAAYASGNLKAFLACYAFSFSPRGNSLLRWRRHKALLFERYHHRMHIKINQLTILHTTAYDLITFRETFEGGNFLDQGIKRLYLTGGKNEKAIIAEEWLPLSLIEKTETAFRRTQTLMACPSDNYRIIVAAQHPLERQGTNLSLKKPNKDLKLKSNVGENRTFLPEERAMDFRP